MATVETLEHKHGKLERTKEHYGALLRALSPNPKDWEYTGEMIDLGSPWGGGGGWCACGHQIRWAFLLHRKTNQAEQVQVGSTCICHFQTINEVTYHDLVEADKALQARLKDAKKAAKKAVQEKNVQAAKETFDTLYAQVQALNSSYVALGKRTPRILWEAWSSSFRVPQQPPQYQRASSLLKWYSKQIERLEQVVSECELQLSPDHIREQLHTNPDVVRVYTIFAELWTKANAKCQEYLRQKKRVPKPLWKVCLSDYFYIPYEAPLSLESTKEIIAWYQENIVILQDAM